MEHRDLEIFLVLADELHFGRTGERVGTSQARVSQAVQRLERRIGAPLFDRTSRRVALTPIGRQLRADLAPAYRQIGEAVERAVAAGRGITGLLRVGFEAPAVADAMSGLLRRFRERHPDCAVEVREAPFADPLRMLRAEEVDVLVTLLPVDEPDLAAGPVVVTEPVVLAVPAAHPLAARAHVTLDDLAALPVLRPSRPAPPYWRPEGEPWATGAGDAIRRGPAVGGFQELLAAVAAGDGACPLGAHVARYFPRPGVAFVPFRDAPDARWALVWHRSGETGRVRALAALAAR